MFTRVFKKEGAAADVTVGNRTGTFDGAGNKAGVADEDASGGAESVGAGEGAGGNGEVDDDGVSDGGIDEFGGDVVEVELVNTSKVVTRSDGGAGVTVEVDVLKIAGFAGGKDGVVETLNVDGVVVFGGDGEGIDKDVIVEGGIIFVGELELVVGSGFVGGEDGFGEAEVFVVVGAKAWEDLEEGSDNDDNDDNQGEDLAEGTDD